MYEKEPTRRTTNFPIYATIIIFLSIIILSATVIPILVLLDFLNTQNQLINPQERAKYLLNQVPLIDGHNDLPTVLYELQQNNWNLDISREPTPEEDQRILNLTGSKIHTTIPRILKGQLGGQFWSTWVSCKEPNPLKTTFEKFSVVYSMVERYPNNFKIALTAADIWKSFREKKVASLFGIEGGHSIDNSILALRAFYKLGARYMTLTHTCNTPWADSANGPLRNGLTDFGIEIIKEMNRLGMIVDLSHVSDRVMDIVLDVSTAPVIFSHSGARSKCNHIRNVPDQILRKVKDKRGVVMVPFYPIFISDLEYQVDREISRQTNSSVEQRFLFQKWQRENPYLRSNVTNIVDHIDYIRRVASIDNVGLGGDFDGIPFTIKNMEDVSKYPEIVIEMLNRGYSDDDVKKVLGLNVLRVFEEVEKVKGQ